MRASKWMMSAAVIVTLGCGSHDDAMHDGGHGDLPPASTVLAPEPWQGELSTAELADENPDQAIVEVTLTARVGEVSYLPGTSSQAWTYAGSVPGPTLRARVGDRIIVHFKNELPESTTIHWHGVRVPAAMDGTTAMQEPIPAGGSFDYEFTALDAGTFWYHPHVRSDSQVEKGLYGAIVISDPAEPPLPSVADEIVVLDDVLVDPVTGALDETIDMRTRMMGREGNLALVSGAQSNLELSVRPGEARRWRVINAANSRYFRLAMSGGRMLRIGGDGGLLEQAEEPADILLVPGQRAEVLVWVERAGATATLQALGYERAMGAGATETIDLLRLSTCADCAVATGPTLPAALRPFTAAAPPTVTREVRLSEMMHGDMVMFLINGEAFPDVAPFDAALGAVETWNVVNASEMDHPFHVHGFLFQPEGAAEWKDTINIPAKGTVPLIVNLQARDGASGSWMYHCHILEHAEGGMMAELRVQ